MDAFRGRGIVRYNLCGMHVLVGIITICLVFAGDSYAVEQGDSRETYIVLYGNLDLPSDCQGFDIENMGKSVKEKIISKVERFRPSDSIGHDVCISLSFIAPDSLSWRLYSRPPLPQGDIAALEVLVGGVAPTPLKFGSMHMDLNFYLGGGCSDTSLGFSPAKPNELDVLIPGYSNSNLADKTVMLNNWARQEVLPAISCICLGVDPKFDGVIQFGHRLEQMALSGTFTHSVEAMDSSWTYWRASLEMAQGDPLIISGKIHLLLAEGRFDWARNILSVSRPFSSDENSGWYLKILEALLSVFYSQLDGLITEGITSFDSGDFRTAQEIFTRILDVYPHSAWALHELALTNWSMKPNGNVVDTTIASRVLESDPFFSASLEATSGKEAYLLIRRLGLKESLESDTLDLKDKLIEWADVSLDIEQYAFAGQVYWLLLSNVRMDDSERRNILHRFIFSMRKLGVNEVEENFSGDFDEACQNLESELRNRMVNSAVFKAMKRQE